MKRGIILLLLFIAFLIQVKADRESIGISVSVTKYDSPPKITILSPENTTYKDGLFNISISENATWCAYSLDGSANVTMTSFNITYFNLTLTSISEGIHNVSFSCNDTVGNSNSTLLRGFSINRTKPTISLISPSNSTSSSGSITFSYNVTHFRNVSSCSLILDSSLVSTSSSITLSQANTIAYSPSAGSYRWSINCTDDIGNIGNSTSFSITVMSSSSADSGGGGGKRQEVEYQLKEEELQEGISRILYPEDKISFNLGISEHNVKILKIGKDYAEIEVRSDPFNDTIFINESKKYNLDNDLFYDIFMRLDGIKNSKANFTIKEIHKLIEISQNLDENTTEEPINNNTEEIKTQTGKKVKREFTILFYLISALIIILLTRRLIKKKIYKKKGPFHRALEIK